MKKLFDLFKRSHLSEQLKNDVLKIRSYYPEAWFVLNPLVVNTWYLPNAVTCATLTAFSTTYTRYMPFIPLRNVKVTGLGFEVITAASVTAQLGIYDSRNYRPYNRIGLVTGLSGGAAGFKSGSVSVKLKALKLYWLAIAVTGALTVRAIPRSALITLLGIRETMTDYHTHYYQIATSLPDVANPTTAYQTDVPAIYIRFEHI